MLISDSELRDISCAVDKELSEFCVEMRYAAAHRNIQSPGCLPVKTDTLPTEIFNLLGAYQLKLIKSSLYPIKT